MVKQGLRIEPNCVRLLLYNYFSSTLGTRGSHLLCSLRRYATVVQKGGGARRGRVLELALRCPFCLREVGQRRVRAVLRVAGAGCLAPHPGRRFAAAVDGAPERSARAEFVRKEAGARPLLVAARAIAPSARRASHPGPVAGSAVFRWGRRALQLL